MVFHNVIIAVISLFKIRINLSYNSNLISPPLGSCDTPDKLIAYLSDIRKGAVHLPHVKVMVVGHGGVGKSTATQTVLLKRQLLSAGEAYMCIFAFSPRLLCWVSIPKSPRSCADDCHMDITQL